VGIRRLIEKQRKNKKKQVAAAAVADLGALRQIEKIINEKTKTSKLPLWM